MHCVLTTRFHGEGTLQRLRLNLNSNSSTFGAGECSGSRCCIVARLIGVEGIDLRSTHKSDGTPFGWNA